MAAALQQRVERDARFASDVSHELRSPLMTLSASIEVMEARRDEMPERAQAALDLLVSDVARFRGSSRTCSRSAASTPGRSGSTSRTCASASSCATPSPCRRRPSVDGAASPRAERRDHQRRQSPPGAGDRQPDRQRPRLRRRRNPRSSIEDGNADAEVLTARQDRRRGPRPGRAGRGAGADLRALRPRHQCRAARGSEGAGLGLALVDEHIRLHGGRVWVEDRSDGQQGARFVIELPARMPIDYVPPSAEWRTRAVADHSGEP